MGGRVSDMVTVAVVTCQTKSRLASCLPVQVYWQQYMCPIGTMRGPCAPIPAALKLTDVQVDAITQAKMLFQTGVLTPGAYT